MVKAIICRSCIRTRLFSFTAMASHSSSLYYFSSFFPTRSWKQSSGDKENEILQSSVREPAKWVSSKWRWDHVLEAFPDPKSWCWFFLVMGISYVPFSVNFCFLIDVTDN